MKKKKEIVTQSTSSADYSSLFNTYSCDISVAELAKALQIPESDISRGENQSEEHCVFQLKGFGKEYNETGSRLRFGPDMSTKNGNKKIIMDLLKEKKKSPTGMLMGRDILLTDTGDCYISFQPLQGRIFILNENYDRFFTITYGLKASVQNRSKEQHDALTKKVKDLANFLVSKHKK
ncbi:hypothetical protein [Winogradskyella sp. R77965]|uniref:hypothetical protein n=1 Tax=Winogradskyella sp. R77965 TaxID=3093872 RepID=UPI0037DCF7A8